MGNMTLLLISVILFLSVLYVLSVKILIAFLFYKSLGDDFPIADNPQQQQWMRQQLVDQGTRKAWERVVTTPLLKAYCWPYMLALILSKTRDFD